MTLKKRKQHFVWRHYLQSWSNNELIYVLFKSSGNIANPNLIGVGQQHDIYKPEALSNDEIERTAALIEKMSHPSLKAIHKKLLNSISSISKMKATIDSNSRPSKEEIELSVSGHNLIEEYHKMIEDVGENYLKMLKCGNYTFWSDDESQESFLFYLFAQFTRTKKSRDRLIKAFENGPKWPFDYKPENVWPILGIIITSNLATYYTIENHLCLHVINNNSSVKFITSDQPVINTKENIDNEDEPPKELEIYYPISPTRALLVTKSKCSECVQFEINEATARSMNKLIFEMAQEQIYAESREELQALLV